MSDDKPQDVNVNVQPSRLWDPIQGPSWAKLVINMTFAGAVLFLFTWQFFRQSEQADRVIEKIQTMLDKQEERRARDQEKEIARLDKLHEYNDGRLRDWIKAQGERQALEGDKVRLELKGIAEQMKLLNDRIRLTTMKE